MRTEILPVNPDQPESGPIARAAEVLRHGGLVAFPTETVYGLGANALEATAIARIFAAKGRPANNPLIVHVGQARQAIDVVGDWPETAARLAEHFWPGPLTLVLPRGKNVCAAVSGSWAHGGRASPGSSRGPGPAPGRRRPHRCTQRQSFRLPVAHLRRARPAQPRRPHRTPAGRRPSSRRPGIDCAGPDHPPTAPASSRIDYSFADRRTNWTDCPSAADDRVRHVSLAFTGSLDAPLCSANAAGMRGRRGSGPGPRTRGAAAKRSAG